MTVAVQIDRAAVLAVPAPERIVTKHQHVIVDRELRVILHARPSSGLAGCNRIIVAAYQVLRAVQLR